jgi:hypothetical protein
VGDADRHVHHHLGPTGLGAVARAHLDQRIGAPRLVRLVDALLVGLHLLGPPADRLGDDGGGVVRQQAGEPGAVAVAVLPPAERAPSLLALGVLPPHPSVLAGEQGQRRRRRPRTILRPPLVGLRRGDLGQGHELRHRQATGLGHLGDRRQLGQRPGRLDRRRRRRRHHGVGGRDPLRPVEAAVDPPRLPLVEHGQQLQPLRLDRPHQPAQVAVRGGEVVRRHRPVPIERTAHTTHRRKGV